MIRMRKMWNLALKNIKFRFREPQQYLFIFGFPILFVFVFWVIFKDMPSSVPPHNQFDVFVWGFIAFTVAFATQSASMAFSREKEKGTLRRLMTTPVRTSSIFGGFLLSEVLVIIIQLAIVYILSFALLGVHFSSILALVLTFLMYILCGLFCVGIGLILAALLKPKLAGELPMIVIMPIVFLSGIFVPLSSEIVYFNPFFWIASFGRELGFSGSGLFDTIKILDFVGSVDTGIAVFWCIPMTILFSAVFLGIGLYLFNKRCLK